jgi:hypothetical protein
MQGLIPQQEEISYPFQMQKTLLVPNLLVLSKPELLRLRVSEARCPHGHSVRTIKLFALDDKVCSFHNVSLEKNEIVSQVEVYSFYARSGDDRINLFIPVQELKIKLDIYKRINVEGFDLCVQTKSKGIFTKGLFIKNIEPYEEKASEEKPTITKEQVIETFGQDKPRLNLPPEVFTAYKHALLLSEVQIGLNLLVVGNPGTDKTEYAMVIKDLAGGAYVDSTNATDVGLIGMAARNEMNNGYHFEGGAVMSAKNRVLVVDEADKVYDSSFFRRLNGVTGNHLMSFNKGNVHFEDTEFYVSFVGFANPIHTRFQAGQIPKMQIEQTFRNNKEFLSRMHLIIALSCGKPDSTQIKDSNFSAIKTYLSYCKSLKVTEKDILPEARAEMLKFYQKHIEDERFFKKLSDLVIAEAKFSMHEKATLEDVREIEKLIDVQSSLLYTRVR